MHFDRIRIARLCRQYGQLLDLPSAIDGPRLLWAIAGNESSFGANATPRHEAAYCYGGKYFKAAKNGNPLAALTKSWGCLAHCSFGPWQILLVNVPTFSPMELMTDAEVSARAALQHLNRNVLRSIDLQRPVANVLRDIGDAFNSGNARDQIIPEEYIRRLVGNYVVPFPKEESQ